MCSMTAYSGMAANRADIAEAVIGGTRSMTVTGLTPQLVSKALSRKFRTGQPTTAVSRDITPPFQPLPLQYQPGSRYTQNGKDHDAMPLTRNEYQRCLALASYRSNSKRPSQCAEQKRRSTHQRRFHKLRKRTPNPNFSWHWAHLFIAAPQVVGCRVSSVATRRDPWHTAHSRRRGCGSPRAHS